MGERDAAWYESDEGSRKVFYARPDLMPSRRHKLSIEADLGCLGVPDIGNHVVYEVVDGTRCVPAPSLDYAWYTAQGTASSVHKI